jgi:hypothetical protein
MWQVIFDDKGCETRSAFIKSRELALADAFDFLGNTYRQQREGVLTKIVGPNGEEIQASQIERLFKELRR